MNFKSYMISKGFFRKKDERIEGRNFGVQFEAASKSMPFLKETIKKEWLDKGYKVTDEFGDSIVIEKADDN